MTYSLKHFRNSFRRGKICMFSFNARTVLGQKDTKISTLLTRCPEDYCSSASLHWTCHLGELESLAQVSVSFCCFTVAKQLHFMSSRNTNENSNSDSTLNSSIMSVFCFVLLQSQGRAHLPKLKSHNQQNSSSSKDLQSIREVCSADVSKGQKLSQVHPHSLSTQLLCCPSHHLNSSGLVCYKGSYQTLPFTLLYPRFPERWLFSAIIALDAVHASVNTLNVIDLKTASIFFKGHLVLCQNEIMDLNESE